MISGYRIYFGNIASAIVLLLAGSSKSTQVKDIGRAQRLWSDYLERKRHGEAK